MCLLGFKQYDDIIIDNFYKYEKKFNNLLLLLNKIDNDENIIMSLIINNLGFSLSENITLNSCKYKEEIYKLFNNEKFINSNFYIYKFMITLDSAKDHGNTCNFNNSNLLYSSSSISSFSSKCIIFTSSIYLIFSYYVIFFIFI